jgi:phosphoserine phosphatase
VGSLFVVTVLGRDREGLVSGLTNLLAEKNINIVDIEQSVIHGLFSMFMLVDVSKTKTTPAAVGRELSVYAKKHRIAATFSPYAEYADGDCGGEKNILKITLFGLDRPGIVAAVAKSLFSASLNIERIKMIARGELLAMELYADAKSVPLNRVRKLMDEAGSKIGVDVIVQPEDAARFRKRLVVFDMDGTIVDQEIIDELAKAAGVGAQVSEITAKGMRGEMDFEESLRRRVAMLRGLPEPVLRKIRSELRLTPGTEELIAALKGMGYKVALISGGFTYFTDALKERLGFDYAFGNDLVIKDGKVAGEVRGEIIDSKKKASIMTDLARKENISREDIVAVGDGANDSIMLQNAGLGIAFNAKDVLKKVADGSITKNNMKGLLFCLGASEKDLKKQKKR